MPVPAAVDRSSGALYMVWQDDLDRDGSVDEAISRSTDGGSTWSAPVSVGAGAPAHTFLPAVAVNDDGVVGVLFYDFRSDLIGDAPLSTDVHLAFFDANLNPLGEVRLTPNSFDLRQSVITGARGYFPGDYVGLASAGEDFVAAFTVTNDLGLPVDYPQDGSALAVDAENRQDVVVVRVTP